MYSPNTICTRPYGNIVAHYFEALAQEASAGFYSLSFRCNMHMHTKTHFNVSKRYHKVSDAIPRRITQIPLHRDSVDGQDVLRLTALDCSSFSHIFCGKLSSAWAGSKSQWKKDVMSCHAHTLPPAAILPLPSLRTILEYFSK